MKITFKIILIITIIFFSKESLDGGLCESNTDCDPNEKEGECKDIKDGFGYCACMEGYNRGGDNNKCIKYVNYNETCDYEEHDLCGEGLWCAGVIRNVGVQLVLYITMKLKNVKKYLIMVKFVM